MKKAKCVKKKQESRHACRVCHKTFNKLGILKLHMDSHHSPVKETENEKNVYPCKDCCKVFKSKEQLNQHSIKHECVSKDKGMKPEERSELTKVISPITKDKPQEHKRYACEVCMKTFRSNIMYVLHKKAHVQDLPYSCGTCQKHFQFP